MNALVHLKVTEVAKGSVAVSAFVEVLLSLAVFVEDDVFGVDVHLLDLFEFFEVLNLWLGGRAGSVRFSVGTGMAQAFIGFFRVRASLHLKSIRFVELASHEFFVSSVAHFQSVCCVCFGGLNRLSRAFFVDLSLSFRDMKKVGLTNFHVFEHFGSCLVVFFYFAK